MSYTIKMSDKEYENLVKEAKRLHDKAIKVSAQLELLCRLMKR